VEEVKVGEEEVEEEVVEDEKRGKAQKTMKMEKGERGEKKRKEEEEEGGGGHRDDGRGEGGGREEEETEVEEVEKYSPLDVSCSAKALKTPKQCFPIRNSPKRCRITRR